MQFKLSLRPANKQDLGKTFIILLPSNGKDEKLAEAGIKFPDPLNQNPDSQGGTLKSLRTCKYVGKVHVDSGIIIDTMISMQSQTPLTRRTQTTACISKLSGHNQLETTRCIVI